MATPQMRLWTYDDYMRMEDDGKRYEVIEGELIEMPAPRTRHQDIAAEITSVLRAHVREHRLGKVLPPLATLSSPPST